MDNTDMTESLMDIREIAITERHAKIFSAFDALPVGDSLILANDHDPRPLYHQLNTKHEGTFAWTYLEEGPDLWRVRILKNAQKPAQKSNCCGNCGG
jgi:uncharacterized protein (DUF2249 family)